MQPVIERFVQQDRDQRGERQTLSRRQLRQGFDKSWRQ
jgi:hypothetical protein